MMSYRAILSGGPLDGVVLSLGFSGPIPDDWPQEIGDSEQEARGRYVVASREPVPFRLGEHPNVLLTATYQWQPA